MRIKFKICLLLPMLTSLCSCSKSDKISFQSCDFTFDTYYNDSYFLLDNKEYHEEIALASHAMALATFNGDEDYTLRSKYLRELWEKEHFDNIYMNDSFYQMPWTDSIGYGLASKHIALNKEDFTLVAVAVRGGNYDGEWASNFTLGLEGDAQGFKEATNQVIEGLTSYLKNYSISGKVKFWISGYSRAAITSNMVAGEIIKMYEEKQYLTNEVHYDEDDIYAYCFEPPLGVEITLEDARKEIYHGIHNLVNYNDFVPLVAPFEWGFARYGVDHYYPDRLNDIYFDESEREKIISLYHFTCGAEKFTDYSVDKWKFFDIGEKANENNLAREMVNPSQGRFNHDLIHELAVNGIQTRDMYAKYVQQGIRDLMATIFGLNSDIEKLNLKNLASIIFEYDFVRTLIMELQEDQSTQFAMDVELLFLQIFGANEKNFDKIEKLYNSNALLLSFFANAYKYRKDVLTQLLYRDNAMGLLVCHMPEVSYSFLCACDSRFMGNKKCKLNDGTYKVLHIDKPASFTLFEKNIKKEVFTYKDGKMNSKHLSGEKLADGSLNIYLPNNGAYEYICNSNGMSIGYIDPLKGETLTTANLPSSGTIE